MTYGGLAALFLAGAALTAVVATLVARLGPRWWGVTALVALALVVLTAAFDNVMIAADLFRYDPSALRGARVLLAPVEDFAWPLVAVLVLPSLWEILDLFGRRRQRGHGR
jgi:lycopene cyclase domain-containing protein